MQTIKLFKQDCSDMLHTADNSIDFIVTSPPYFNAKDYDGNVLFESLREYNKFMLGTIGEMYRVLKPGRILALNISPIIDQSSGHRIPLHLIMGRLITKYPFLYMDDIDWKKPDGAAPPRSGSWVKNKNKPMTYYPNPVKESLLIYKKIGKAQLPRIETYRPIRFPKGFFAKQRQEFLMIEGKKTKIPKWLLTDIWKFQPSQVEWKFGGKTYHHDAPFPLVLPYLLIQLYSFEGETVLDPFIGAGTTGVACKELNRNCVGYDKYDITLAKKRIGWGEQKLGEEIKYMSVE